MEHLTMVMSNTLKQFFTPTFSRAPGRTFFFILLVILTTLLLTMLQVFPSMPDPDGFFHAFMSVQTWEQGFVTLFPYLPESILGNYWTDQHWLYHLLASPVTQIMDPLWAVKVVAVLLGIFYIALFHGILERLLASPRASFWWTIALLSSGPFISRLVQVKAQPFALIFLLLGIFFYVKKRYSVIPLIQFFYVLSHGSFLLLPILIVWSLIYEFLFDRKAFFTKKTVFVPFALGLATVAGVIVQPTFPDNILFYWYQIVQIGLIGVSELTFTGTEWNAITSLGLFKSLGILSVISGVLFILFVHYRIIPEKQTRFFLWLLLPLCILTLRSIRNFELFTPFLVISLALLFQQVYPYCAIIQLRRRLSESVIVTSFLGGVAAVSILIIFLMPLVKVYTWQAAGVPFDFLKEEGLYMKEHTDASSLVSNTRWDIFPMLLYYSDGKRFMTGMDPAFYYFGNPEGYRALVEARDTGSVDALIKSIQQEYTTVYIAMHSSDKENKTIPTSEQYTLILRKEGDIVSIYEVEK